MERTLQVLQAENVLLLIQTNRWLKNDTGVVGSDVNWFEGKLPLKLSVQISVFSSQSFVEGTSSTNSNFKDLEKFRSGCMLLYY
jgi:hypothetical protein